MSYCSKNHAINCVVVTLNKCLPSPGDELCISLTSHAATRWDLGGKMDSFSWSSTPHELAFQVTFQDRRIMLHSWDK